RRCRSSPRGWPRRSADWGTRRPSIGLSTAADGRTRKGAAAMPNVKHMKWWGWGVEGVGFHHEDKPGMAPFVLKAIDLDLNSAPEVTVDFVSLDIPEPKIDAGLLDRLTEVVGADN